MVLRSYAVASSKRGMNSFTSCTRWLFRFKLYRYKVGEFTFRKLVASKRQLFSICTMRDSDILKVKCSLVSIELHCMWGKLGPLKVLTNITLLVFDFWVLVCSYRAVEIIHFI